MEVSFTIKYDKSICHSAKYNIEDVINHPLCFSLYRTKCKIYLDKKYLFLYHKSYTRYYPMIDINKDDEEYLIHESYKMVHRTKYTADNIDTFKYVYRQIYNANKNDTAYMSYVPQDHGIIKIVGEKSLSSDDANGVITSEYKFLQKNELYMSEASNNVFIKSNNNNLGIMKALNKLEINTKAMFKEAFEKHLKNSNSHIFKNDAISVGTQISHMRENKLDKSLYRDKPHIYMNEQTVADTRDKAMFIDNLYKSIKNTQPDIYKNREVIIKNGLNNSLHYIQDPEWVSSQNINLHSLESYIKLSAHDKTLYKFNDSSFLGKHTSRLDYKNNTVRASVDTNSAFINDTQDFYKTEGNNIAIYDNTSVRKYKNNVNQSVNNYLYTELYIKSINDAMKYNVMGDRRIKELAKEITRFKFLFKRKNEVEYNNKLTTLSRESNNLIKNEEVKNLSKYDVGFSFDNIIHIAKYSPGTTINDSYVISLDRIRKDLSIINDYKFISRKTKFIQFNDELTRLKFYHDKTMDVDSFFFIDLVNKSTYIEHHNITVNKDMLKTYIDDWSRNTISTAPKAIEYQQNLFISKNSIGTYGLSDYNIVMIRKDPQGIMLEDSYLSITKEPYGFSILDTIINIRKDNKSTYMLKDGLGFKKAEKPFYFVFDTDVWVKKGLRDSSMIYENLFISKGLKDSSMVYENLFVNKRYKDTSMIYENLFMGKDKKDTWLPYDNLFTSQHDKSTGNMDNILNVYRTPSGVFFNQENVNASISGKPIYSTESIAINTDDKPVEILNYNLGINVDGKGIDLSKTYFINTDYRSTLLNESMLDVDLETRPGTIKDVITASQTINKGMFDPGKMSLSQDMEYAFFNTRFENQVNQTRYIGDLPKDNALMTTKNRKNANLHDQIGKFVKVMHYDGIGDVEWAMSGNMDELILPYNDYKYSDLLSKLLYEDGTLNLNYVKNYDSTTGEYTVKLPIENPIDIYAKIGREYLDIDVNIIVLVINIVREIWQQNMFRYAGMPADDSLKDIMIKTDEKIRSQYTLLLHREKMDQAERCMQLIRWYAEMAILNNCDYVLKFDTQKVAVDYYNKSFGPLEDIIVLTNMYISDEYILEPIDATQACSISFSRNRVTPGLPYNLFFKLYNINTSSSISIIDNTGAAKTKHYDPGIHEINVELENVVYLRFIPTKKHQSINIANIGIDNVTMRGFTVSYKGRIGETNAVLQDLLDRMLIVGELSEDLKQIVENVTPVTVAIDTITKYFELHHKDKLKGKRLITKK